MAAALLVGGVIALMIFGSGIGLILLFVILIVVIAVGIYQEISAKSDPKG